MNKYERQVRVTSAEGSLTSTTHRCAANAAATVNESPDIKHTQQLKWQRNRRTQFLHSP